MGIKRCIYHSFPDNQLDKIPLLKITQKIEDQIKKIEPDIIFTHFENDLNLDHQIINRAVVTATRPKPNHKLKKILLFETLSSTEWKFSNKAKVFNPNYFVDISKTINHKIKSIKCYKKKSSIGLIQDQKRCKDSSNVQRTVCWSKICRSISIIKKYRSKIFQKIKNYVWSSRYLQFRWNKN